MYDIQMSIQISHYPSKTNAEELVLFKLFYLSIIKWPKIVVQFQHCVVLKSGKIETRMCLESNNYICKRGSTACGLEGWDPLNILPDKFLGHMQKTVFIT